MSCLRALLCLIFPPAAVLDEFDHYLDEDEPLAQVEKGELEQTLV